MEEQALCQLCGEPMPEGEEMFNYHGYSGPCPKPMKERTECGQKDRDAEILRLLQGDIVYYGPHACSMCGARICKVSREQGGFEFDYPEGIIYPNTHWVGHICRTITVQQQTEDFWGGTHPIGPKFGANFVEKQENKLEKI